jgi:putative transcriptional regulator
MTMRTESETMYHYTESGLPNVWLVNGYTVTDTPYGKGVSINDLQGLHRVIGRALVSKPRLAGAEIRFLRKELGCSQKGLAEIIGASEQTVSLWERDRGQIQPAADRILRLFYAEHVAGNVQVRKFMEQRAEAERGRQPRSRKLTLEKGRTWREAVAA